MLSALIAAAPGRDTPLIADHLEAAGIHVAGDVACTAIVQTAVQTAPDVVICYDPCPDAALFDGVAALMAASPRPVVLFTDDPDAGKIAQALASGVSAYVADGYHARRLRPVIHLAMARFRRDQAQAAELAHLQLRFAERTLVDRAKGILMGARQLREEEAYRALRTAAMQAKQRIGQVARVVVDGALYAEAVNRAGQLRMLSQRLAKLYALACAQVDSGETAATCARSVEEAEANLAALRRTLPAASFGDLLDAVARPWSALKTELEAAPATARLQLVDGLAGEMLARAERLTDNLEVASFAAALHVINVSGRQRMLSQRLAKEALAAALLDGEAAERFRAAMARTHAEFTQGMSYLAAVPLTNAAIRGELDDAGANWLRFEASLACADRTDGRHLIATLSERMLANFDRLTSHYERGMQALSG